jgi:hypothetical protein
LNHIGGFTVNSTSEYYKEHFPSINSTILSHLNITECTIGRQLEEVRFCSIL